MERYCENIVEYFHMLCFTSALTATAYFFLLIM